MSIREYFCVNPRILLCQCDTDKTDDINGSFTASSDKLRSINPSARSAGGASSSELGGGTPRSADTSMISSWFHFYFFKP